MQSSRAWRLDGVPIAICIPAHPHTLAGNAAPQAWPHYTVIFASSCGEGHNHGSSIGHKGALLVETEGTENALGLVPLLDGFSDRFRWYRVLNRDSVQPRKGRFNLFAIDDRMLKLNVESAKS